MLAVSFNGPKSILFLILDQVLAKSSFQLHYNIRHLCWPVSFNGPKSIFFLILDQVLAKSSFQLHYNVRHGDFLIFFPNFFLTPSNEFIFSFIRMADDFL